MDEVRPVVFNVLNGVPLALTEAAARVMVDVLLNLSIEAFLGWLFSSHLLDLERLFRLVPIQAVEEPAFNILRPIGVCSQRPVHDGCLLA